MVASRLRNDFPATYAAELCMWPFAQARWCCPLALASPSSPTSSPCCCPLASSLLSYPPCPLSHSFQTLNFSSVPVAHQLLYTNVVCLVDSTLLSWVKHRSMEQGGLLTLWLHINGSARGGVPERGAGGEVGSSRGGEAGPSSPLSGSSGGDGMGKRKGGRQHVVPVGFEHAPLRWPTGPGRSRLRHPNVDASLACGHGSSTSSPFVTVGSWGVVHPAPGPATCVCTFT